MPILDEMGDNLEIQEIPQNPFYVDIVVERFLARVGVSSLKKLIGLDMKWNHLGIKELEKRASKGQLKAVDLSGESYQKMIDEFMDTTWSNPKIFRSFRLNFESLTKENYRHILTYSPIFLQLDIKNKSEFMEDELKILHHFLAQIALEIQELEIHIQLDPPENQRVPGLKPSDQLGPILPKLTRFAFFGYNINWNWFQNGALLRPFIFIMSKGGEVDHTPKLAILEMEAIIGDNMSLDPIFGTDQLTKLELSRWSRLTQIKFLFFGAPLKVTIFLHSLGQAGMRLESLDLYLDLNGWEWSSICQNLSNFFQTQTQSLKILNFKCFDIFTYPKIKFPIFGVLHTLKLELKYPSIIRPLMPVNFQMFEMGPLSVHFPKLDLMETHNSSFLASSFFPEGVHTEPISLTSLAIYENHSDGAQNLEILKKVFKLLGDKFRSVVHFRCDGSFLQEKGPKKSCIQSLSKFFGLTLIKDDEMKLPWMKSLNVLEFNYVRGPLEISHLKGLEKLIVSEKDPPKITKEYLSFFKKVRRLKLRVIMFNFFGKMKISDQDMKKFENYFPFPVKFISQEDNSTYINN